MGGGRTGGLRETAVDGAYFVQLPHDVRRQRGARDVDQEVVWAALHRDPFWCVSKTIPAHLSFCLDQPRPVLLSRTH